MRIMGLLRVRKTLRPDPEEHARRAPASWRMGPKGHVSTLGRPSRRLALGLAHHDEADKLGVSQFITLSSRSLSSRSSAAEEQLSRLENAIWSFRERTGALHRP